MWVVDLANGGGGGGVFFSLCILPELIFQYFL